MRGGGKRGGARIKRVCNEGVTLREEGQSPHASIQKPADDVREKEKQARRHSVRDRERKGERKREREDRRRGAS